MLRNLIMAAGLLGLAWSCSPAAQTGADAGPAQAQAGEAQAAEGGPAGGEAIITAWARQHEGLIEPVDMFFGDFTGDGAADAIAFAYVATGGSSANLVIGLFRNEGGRLAFWRTDETVYGMEPRDVAFAPGRITLTTTMPRPGDPHCCPTGSQTWTIDAARATPY
ncbi:MAG: hypothetical protein AB7O04_10475 [Hyphomonadaceae bacterium]